MTPWSRRTFLGTTAAGAATLVVPRFLVGCAKNDAVVAATTALPENPFLAWFGIDDGVIRRVMAELTARGADFADLYFQHTRANAISLEDGVINRASTSVDQGVGLRVVVGDQIGYAFTEDLGLESMLAAARTAAAIAGGAPVPAPERFTVVDPGAFYRTAVPWDAVGVAEKLPLIEKTAARARALEPAVDKVTVSWQDHDERVLIATLDGKIVTDRRPMSRLWVTVTAKKGDQTQSNGSNLAGRHGLEWYTDERVDLVTKQAIDRTMILFDAVRPPAGELPVVLGAGASGILLHEAIGHGMEADFNRKGTSIYADLMGKPVAPDFVTIVDDGTLPGERGSLNTDDEGHDTERTLLVANGVLNSYLHDAISAKHYGVKPTGSGRRESFRHPILPRMRATFMEAGPHTRDEMVASITGTGIIAETYTNGQVQIGAGDYTFYVKNGWLVEGGKITAPIKDVNIIGNGPETLKRVVMVGDDPTLDTGGWTCGKDGQSVPVSQGMPSVLVSKLTVGGVHG